MISGCMKGLLSALLALTSVFAAGTPVTAERSVTVMGTNFRVAVGAEARAGGGQCRPHLAEVVHLTVVDQAVLSAPQRLVRARGRIEDGESRVAGIARYRWRSVWTRGGPIERPLADAVRPPVTQGLGRSARPPQINGPATLEDQEQSAHWYWSWGLGPAAHCMSAPIQV